MLLVVTGSVSERLERRKGRPNANIMAPTFINHITSAGRPGRLAAWLGLVLVAFVLRRRGALAWIPELHMTGRHRTLDDERRGRLQRLTAEEHGFSRRRLPRRQTVVI